MRPQAQRRSAQHDQLLLLAQLGRLAPAVQVALTLPLLIGFVFYVRWLERGIAHLRESKGNIVTIASIAAKHPDAGPLAYTVSKAGVWMLTKVLALELARHKIRVNTIAPGPVDTPGAAERLFPDPMIMEGIRKTIPLRRFATLSPVPGFRRWLERNADKALLGRIADPAWHLGAVPEDLEKQLTRLCAYYLLHAKQDEEPLDPVAFPAVELIKAAGERGWKGSDVAGAEPVERVGQVFGDLIGVPTFDLMALHHVDELTVLQQRDRR